MLGRYDNGPTQAKHPPVCPRSTPTPRPCALRSRVPTPCSSSRAGSPPTDCTLTFGRDHLHTEAVLDESGMRWVYQLVTGQRLIVALATGVTNARHQMSTVTSPERSVPAGTA